MLNYCCKDAGMVTGLSDNGALHGRVANTQGQAEPALSSSNRLAMLMCGPGIGDW